MGNGPKTLADNTDKIIEGWEQLAPDATFAKMTFAQYKTAVQPSVDARQKLKDLRAQTISVETARDQADVVTNPLNQKVVDSIKGDPAFGDDSDLYGAIGYVRKSKRASGLTRKAKDAPQAPTK